MTKKIKKIKKHIINDYVLEEKYLNFKNYLWHIIHGSKLIRGCALSELE